MKKISEVCKIVGVTRRTLQEYDKIGLVKPSCKTEGGYWLYDDQAIVNLMLCKLLVKAGCRRNDIKRILDSPLSNLTQELSQVAERLQEQQKQIEGMLHAINLFQKCLTSPDVVAPSADASLLQRLYQERSFSDRLDDLAMLSCELENPEQLLQFWEPLRTIGNLKNNSPASPTVQAQVKNFYFSLTEKAVPSQARAGQQDLEIVDLFADAIKECLEDPMIQEYLLMMYQQDSDSLEFICRAIEIFQKTYHLRKK